MKERVQSRCGKTSCLTKLRNFCRQEGVEDLFRHRRSCEGTLSNRLVTGDNRTTGRKGLRQSKIEVRAFALLNSSLTGDYILRPVVGCVWFNDCRWLQPDPNNTEGVRTFVASMFVLG